MKLLIEVEVTDVESEHVDALTERLCDNIVNNCDEYFDFYDDNHCNCPDCSGHEEEVGLYVRTAAPVTLSELRARGDLIGTSTL